MKVYFTAATTEDGEHLTQKKEIISSIRKLKNTLTSGEQIISPASLKEDISLPSSEIFNREKERIDESDCIVAEVTKPSSGAGGEIVYALLHHKPVLALFYKDAENRLTPMIAGNPSENLYLENYEDDNVEIILRRFFSQVEITKNRKGKLIVIDGGDGSGKATQSELLITYLKNKDVKVKYMDFPRYYTSFHGRVVGRFLSGEFGGLEVVSPYLASLAYALDRASAKEEMDEWLISGGTIISNRYATSNMAHQGARLPAEKRKEFIDWIDELEYKVHKIPREDIVVYLYVPWKIGYELTKKKTDRKYLAGALDIQEVDLSHRQEAEKMYLSLAKSRPNWVIINCVKDGVILSKEAIQTMVRDVLKSKKLIP